MCAVKEIKMSLSVVVGGQYGGEGKGLITAFLAMRDGVEILVKTGGPNSGHSFKKDGELFRVRMLPSGFNCGPSTVVIPPGCLIHSATLLGEAAQFNFGGRLIVDPRAGIITEDYIQEQAGDAFYRHAGSTLTGTGAAMAARARRRLGLARDEAVLHDFLGDTTAYLREALEAGKAVLVEGSQGYGLSNYHGEYPFVTSRDTTVGAFLGQIGLGPKFLTQVILAVKCLPTRNRIGDGTLPNELPDHIISARAEYLEEHGGGTYNELGDRRRVGLFDFEGVRRAVAANTPDFLALTGLDRLAACLPDSSIASHYVSPDAFVRTLEQWYGMPVGLQSWGPAVTDVLDRRHGGAKPQG